MLDDDYFLPPVNVSVASISSNKANHILGPDGQVYTQGEAAKLGLIIRTACEACRNRKLKCCLSCLHFQISMWAKDGKSD